MTGLTRLFPLPAPGPALAGAVASLGLTILCLGCEPSGGTTPAPAGGAPAEIADISGRYDLSGMTTAPGTNHKRKISGTMVISQQGDAYTASYEFETLFPGEDKPMEADVIGVGEGRLEGRKLVGTARTQIVISKVPGVDPGFAFVPRTVTTRIVSESEAMFSPDGSLSVDIVSHAAEGEEYTATRTRMTGVRVADLTPQVAAANSD